MSVFLKWPLTWSLISVSTALLISGCGPYGSASEQSPVFYGQVENILQDKCVSCHFTGGLAPFPLETLEQVRTMASVVADSVKSGRMPPWPPAQDCWPLAAPRALSQEQKTLLLEWLEGDQAPGSEANHRPLPEEDVNPLGEPQKRVQMEVPFVPSTVEDEYRCFIMDPQLEEDIFLTATYVEPGNDAIVHHVVLFEDPTGASLALDAEDERAGYECEGSAGEDMINLGNWVPGDGPDVLPAGTGLRLHAGSKLVMQVHYHARGTEQTDQTSVGLYLSDDETLLPADYIRVGNRNFTIPAGSQYYVVTAEFRFPSDGWVWGAGGHMHLLGQEIFVEYEPENEPTQCMLHIPDWDFGWQGNYFFEKAIPVSFGERMRVTCRFDNSDQNPDNPHVPPRDVSWGESSFDEMCVSGIYYVANPETRQGY
ncbi:MAG: hypothetical protein ACKO6N_17040 [Myxococcota bacterium]